MAGDIIPKQMNCGFCKKLFAYKRPTRLFCSNACVKKNFKQKTIKQCLHCEKDFNPDRHEQVFCSRQCSGTFNRQSINFKLRLEIDSLKRISKKKNPVLYSIKLLKEISALLRISRAKNKKDYQGFKSGEKSKRTCYSCNVKFVFTVYDGRPPKYCKECKPIAYKELEMKGRRISKAKRRARIKNLPREPIDPIEIFKRDNWNCHICKKKTSQKLRGTHEPNAPELDHIVTISEGGSHLKENVACACRACNQKKSGKSFGQLFLFGG